MNTWQGLDAEKLFLCAVVNLGYRLVAETNAFVACTIRQATQWEDQHEAVDFILTLSRDGYGRARPVIPMQLTLAASDSASPMLQVKQKMHTEGKIALFWPVPELGQEESLELFRQAAIGDVLALQRFGEILDAVCYEFLKRRAQREKPWRLGRPQPKVVNTRKPERVVVGVVDDYILVRMGEGKRGKQCPKRHSGVHVHILVSRDAPAHTLCQWYDCAICRRKGSQAWPETAEEAVELWLSPSVDTQRKTIATMLSIVTARGKRVWKNLRRPKNLGRLPEQLQQQIRAIIYGEGPENDRLDEIQKLLIVATA